MRGWGAWVGVVQAKERAFWREAGQQCGWSVREEREWAG